MALLDLGFFTKGGLVSPHSTATPEKAGDYVGPYRLVAPLGQGGFGCVWRAEQTEPVQRELALKLIKPGMDSCEIIARFEAEREALALMNHPNIAAVLDAGASVNKRLYFVMELVEGLPITEYCDNRQLSIRERMEIFLPVCRAVQHAHQKDIIHRDLKPSNILVSTVESEPVPNVLDFGIAKALGCDDDDDPHGVVRTTLGTIVGTPRYMSPEQAGSTPDVDPRSDVYSLGVVLCELLTGLCPFPQPPSDIENALRWVREVEAVKPSTQVQIPSPAVGKAAEFRRLDIGRFVQSLTGELDRITLKALEKDRSLRYETPAALAHDVERHLNQDALRTAAQH